MIDFCTVVFEPELDVLKLQAQSIERYCANLGIQNIYIIVNDSSNLTSKISANWWGSLSSKVTILHRNIFYSNWHSNGWLNQQLLKLLIPSISYNKYCIALDAKTIFVNTVEIHDFVNQQNQITTGLLDIYPVFDSSRQIVNQTYSIDLKQQIGPGGVPFVFHNNTVRSMIAETTELVNQDFPAWFLSQGMLTEFILYSGFVQYKYQSLNSMYTTETNIRPVNICHSEVDQATSKIKSMKTATTVSIHRNAWKQLTDAQRYRYRQLLVDRGISQAWNLS